MSTKVVTPEFRVAFPNVFTAKRNELSGKDDFSLVALFPKGADLTALKKAAAAALEKKWGADKTKWPKGLKLPFRDQADRARENEETGEMVLPQGYEAGAIYLNLKSNVRPGLVDAAKQPILDSAEFYGGCYARASVNAYAYDMKGNKGVGFGLINLQKTRDGEHFGVRSKPEDDFGVVEGAKKDDGKTPDDTDDLFS